VPTKRTIIPPLNVHFKNENKSLERLRGDPSKWTTKSGGGLVGGGWVGGGGGGGSITRNASGIIPSRGSRGQKGRKGRQKGKRL